MICKHLIKLKGVVNADFFHKIQRNHNYPFIQDGIYEISISSTVRTTTIPETENADLTEEIWKDHIIIYDRLINITEKALGLLKEHKETKNSQWIKGVERNFLLIENMVREVGVDVRYNAINMESSFQQYEIFELRSVISFIFSNC